MFKVSHVGETIIRRIFSCEILKKTIMSIKSTIAAVAASPFLLAGAAFAGPYVNVESNISYPDGDYSGATTALHIGYEGSLSESADFLPIQHCSYNTHQHQFFDVSVQRYEYPLS